MSKSLFITGSDTDVGKTVITAAITHILKVNGYKVISYKPIQSGGIELDGSLIPGDSAFVNETADLTEDISLMNTYCLKEAISPHRAAEKENVNIDTNRFIEHYNKLKEIYDYIIIEGAGGLVVPIIRDEYYMYDLINDLDCNTLLVTRPGVGTINHTCLSVNFLKQHNITLKGIVLNGYSGHDYEDDNMSIIKSITKIDNIMKFPHLEEEFKVKKAMQKRFEETFSIDEVKQLFE